MTAASAKASPPTIEYRRMVTDIWPSCRLTVTAASDSSGGGIERRRGETASIAVGVVVVHVFAVFVLVFAVERIQRLADGGRKIFAARFRRVGVTQKLFDVVENFLQIVFCLNRQFPERRNSDIEGDGIADEISRPN